MTNLADTAASANQGAYYDARYQRGYMQDFTDFYEACRLRTIDASLDALALSPKRALDYGCGEGRYLDVLAAHYPAAEVVGSDISAVGLRIAHQRAPHAELVQMTDEHVPLPDESVDLVLSVEVLEHVADVRRATAEIGRVLAPGGVAVISTPCANPWSIEWIAMQATRGLQRSQDGFGRFASDEPGHLRRLTSGELAALLEVAGLTVERQWFRGQVFAYPAATRYARRLLPARLRVEVGMLDWRLFRRLRNGSTMLLVARKH